MGFKLMKRSGFLIKISYVKFMEEWELFYYKIVLFNIFDVF